MAQAMYYAKIVYNANGGSGAPAAQSAGTFTEGGSVNIAVSSGTSTRQYYDFKGWALTSGATSGMSGGTVLTLTASTTPLAANARVYNLYAAWQHKTAVLSYNANGGSNAPSSQTVNQNEWFTLRTGTPTRTGYTFLGWNTSSTATAATYQPGDSARIVGNMTLYAVWKVSNSTISSVTSSVAMDGSSTGTISISSINSSYTHVATITLGSQSQTVNFAAGVSSATFTLPASWQSQVPNATSGTATVSLKTYNGSSQVGGADTKTFSATVPSSVVPTISVVTDNVNSNATVDGWDILLQGYSQIKLTATASGTAGSTIANISFTGDGLAQNGTSNIATSAVLTLSGSRTWTVVVTDSRGRTATATVTATVHEYALPTIDSLVAFRSDSSGNRDDAAGTYLNATGTFSYSSCDSHNTLSVDKIEYEAEDAQSWTLGQDNAVSGDAYNFGGGLITETKMFHVRMSLTDALGNSATYTVDVSPIVGYGFGLKNDRVHFGGPCKEKGFVCDFDTRFEGVVDVAPRRCYTKLSSAGWYRVFVYDADVASYVVGDLGFVVDVMLIEWARQIHKITLAGVLGSCGWINEFSYTNVNYFDKIRYMQNGTHGYIDVHYIGSSSNRDESCYFDVKTIKPEMRKQFYSVDFISVLDAPAGETVVSMYTFLTNTSHPNITHGTGSPSGGHDGDVFIKHS